MEFTKIKTLALKLKSSASCLPPSAFQKGQMAIVMVLTTLLFLLIMIPVIEMFVKNEAKWSVKEKKTTLAFHLAEAAVDRGYWKLIENSDNWDIISNGGTIAGYANDKDYSDIEGGTYRINISSGENVREVVIIGTGKDSTNNEYRAIKAIYQKQGVEAAIHAPSIAVTGNMNIHWGPMMSLSSLDLRGSANELYPRKYSRGAITANGTYPDRDTNPNSPNKGPQSDPYIEWWSYNEPPGVPDILEPDTSYYMQLAKNQGYYYTSNKVINNLVDTDCMVGSDPKVRFFENNVRFGGSKYFCGVLIVLGDLTFVSGGKDPQGAITVTPPSTAWKEYQLNLPINNGATESGDMSTWNFFSAPAPYGDTSAPDEYPGDAGYHTVSDYNFVSGRVASGDLGGVQSRPLSFKGYIYVGGTFDASGTTRIYGAVQVAGGGAVGSGAGDIFYDSSLEVKTVSNAISRLSWYEIKPTEF